MENIGIILIGIGIGIINLSGALFGLFVSNVINSVNQYIKSR